RSPGGAAIIRKKNGRRLAPARGLCPEPERRPPWPGGGAGAVMRRLVLRRLALVPVTLLGAALLVFAMLRLVPGDPVEIMLGESAAPADVAALRHDLGLALPLPAQLARF